MFVEVEQADYADGEGGPRKYSFPGATIHGFICYERGYETKPPYRRAYGPTRWEAVARFIALFIADVQTLEINAPSTSGTDMDKH